MGKLKAFFICFCFVTVLCGIAASLDDGSELESGGNNGNNEGEEQWTNDDNDKNNNYDESGSHSYDEQSDKNDRNSDATSYSQNSGYQKQTPAKVIRQLQGPQRLNEIYTNVNADAEYASGNESHQQVLLYLKFPRDFEKIDPRNPNSLFTWRRTAIFTGDTTNILSADNGAFKLVDARYGAPGYLQMTSLPFVFAFSYQEATLGPKQDQPVGRNERILGRMKLTCHIINAEKTPYNRTEVSRPDDDVRSADCDLQMSDVNNTFPLFTIHMTNKSIWAGYIAATFAARRKVGIRERYDSIVDAGIELDKRQNVVNFYLNGYKVWTINSIGAPPPDDGVTKIDYGRVSTPTLVNITTVAYTFGISKSLDRADPNTSDETRLLRIREVNSPFYSPSASFYYPNPNRLNFLWGQGAVLKAYKLLIVKTTSRRSPALPAEYGSSAKTNDH